MNASPYAGPRVHAMSQRVLTVPRSSNPGETRCVQPCGDERTARGFLLLRRVLLERIVLCLLARRFVSFFLGLLVLRLVGLTVLSRLGWRACGGEACRECHDVYLLGCRGECHLSTVRATTGRTYG